MPLVQIHLLAVGAWLGLVAGEAVLELTSRDAPARRLAARVHGWIDIVAEGPLILLVLVTGALLLAQHWPPKPWLVVKVACALVAVIVNIICIGLVHMRMKTNDDRRILALSRLVTTTGLAIPFALAALAIGLSGLSLR